MEREGGIRHRERETESLGAKYILCTRTKNSSLSPLGVCIYTQSVGTCVRAERLRVSQKKRKNKLKKNWKNIAAMQHRYVLYSKQFLVSTKLLRSYIRSCVFINVLHGSADRLVKKYLPLQWQHRVATPRQSSVALCAYCCISSPQEKQEKKVRRKETPGRDTGHSTRSPGASTANCNCNDIHDAPNEKSERKKGRSNAGLSGTVTSTDRLYLCELRMGFFVALASASSDDRNVELLPIDSVPETHTRNESRIAAGGGPGRRGIPAGICVCASRSRACVIPEPTPARRLRPRPNVRCPPPPSCTYNSKCLCHSHSSSSDRATPRVVHEFRPRIPDNYKREDQAELTYLHAMTIGCSGSRSLPVLLHEARLNNAISAARCVSAAPTSVYFLLLSLSLRRRNRNEEDSGVVVTVGSDEAYVSAANDSSGAAASREQQQQQQQQQQNLEDGTSVGEANERLQQEQEQQEQQRNAASSGRVENDDEDSAQGQSRVATIQVQVQGMETEWRNAYGEHPLSAATTAMLHLQPQHQVQVSAVTGHPVDDEQQPQHVVNPFNVYEFYKMPDKEVVLPGNVNMKLPSTTSSGANTCLSTSTRGRISRNLPHRFYPFRYYK
ncbi:unnamed protein product [Trichogramma brassicae]|uniref:Uncharacterized protein n=1 Tax=Trichogramma brassicae TaxID=86971 RepID=A0A6H5J6N7_9HYME|nr:unnamed protein product [Trichogramma brassicae]